MSKPCICTISGKQWQLSQFHNNSCMALSYWLNWICQSLCITYWSVRDNYNDNYNARSTFSSHSYLYPIKYYIRLVSMCFLGTVLWLILVQQVTYLHSMWLQLKSTFVPPATFLHSPALQVKTQQPQAFRLLHYYLSNFSFSELKSDSKVFKLNKKNLCCFWTIIRLFSFMYCFEALNVTLFWRFYGWRCFLVQISRDWKIELFSQRTKDCQNLRY